MWWWIAGGIVVVVAAFVGWIIWELLNAPVFDSDGSLIDDLFDKDDEDAFNKEDIECQKKQKIGCELPS